ncbi:MAG TPA: DUF1073 domain-containing protein [Thermodesulfobacteriota bacterium]|nr:DUF1073 domain-containing protein [Thermodesulfobacteriota bacterium]
MGEEKMIWPFKTNKSIDYQAAKVKSSRRLDGWTNLFTGLGTFKDKLARTFFSYRPQLTYQELRNLYRTDGICSKIIDLLPNDMTREPLKITNDPDGIIDKRLNELHILPLCNQAMKWARLFGGAVILLDIDDGQTLDQPVALDRIMRINEATAIDAQWIYPSDYGRFRRPEFYELSRDKYAKIHRSRLLIFEGTTTTEEDRCENRGWSSSIMERNYEPLRAYGSNLRNVSHLIQDIAQTVYKFLGFNAAIASNKEEAEEAIKAKIECIDAGRSNFNAIVIDAEDSYERKSTTVSGMPELVKLSKDHLVATSDTPHTKLFNESPGSSLGESGGSQSRDWYDKVKSAQENLLRPELELFFSYLQAELDLKEPIYFEFHSLWQPTRKEQAEINKLDMETDKGYLEYGVLGVEEIRKELSSRGTYNIDGEEIPTDADFSKEKATETEEDATYEVPSRSGERLPQSTFKTV